MHHPRLELIKEKLRKLKELDTEYKIFGADEHHYRLNPPQTEVELKTFEAQHQCALPEEYRLYLSKIGNGGAGPFYGLFSLEDGLKEAENYAAPDPLAQNFPYTNDATKEFVEYYNALIEEGDEDKINFIPVPASLPGIIPLAYYGHDWNYVLVVKGEQAGKVWMVGDYLSPCIFKGAQMGFFEWFEHWLDQSFQELNPAAAQDEAVSEDQTVLDYSRKNIREIPQEAFVCKDLKKLDLSRNDFEEFPKDILQFSKLRTLDMSKNPLVDISPRIGELSMLKKLILSYNQHLTLPDTLEQVPLEELTMFYNASLQQIPEVVGRIGALRCLYFSHCDRLQKLPENIGNLKQLEVFQLDHCGALEELPPSFVDLSALKSLHLGQTKLKKLPENFERLQNLQFLGLNIDELDLEDAFEKLKKLPKLSFLSLSLQLTYPESMSELKNLHHLVINQNYLLANQGHKRLPVPEQITLIPHLEILDLVNNNQAQSLPATIGRLKELRELSIGSTAIKEFPESFRQLSRLEKIYGGVEEDAKSPYGVRPEEKKKVEQWFPKTEISMW